MVGIVIHGGAGTIHGEDRRKLSAEGTDQAANVGFKILSEGGTAIEAVMRAVEVMENLPQFNAGYGSVVTEEETIEMDAMIVDGFTKNMGGVMGISRIQNPILLCRTIMEESDHLLFAGSGAEKFASSHGIELIDSEELITQRVRDRYQNWLKTKSHDKTDPEGRDKYGTVGAVALDKDGKLASATSTGGTLGKQMGRIGDTPIFGAGTYADTDIAVSATGVGEYIIQGMVALRIKEYSSQNTLGEATRKALEEIKTQFGPLGVICIDRDGQFVMDKTTKDLAFSYKSNTESGNFLDIE